MQQLAHFRHGNAGSDTDRPDALERSIRRIVRRGQAFVANAARRDPKSSDDQWCAADVEAKPKTAVVAGSVPCFHLPAKWAC
jgi:hypothetical protein